MHFKSINPYDLSVVEEYPIMTDHEVQSKIKRSEEAFAQWRLTDFSERAALLKNVASVLLENKEKYAHLITSEMGKVLKESLAEIEKSAKNCTFYAENAERFLEEEVISAPELRKASIQFDPLGCIFSIMPWNFPFWQVFRYAAKALMAGNVTMLKHAQNVSGCALAIQDIFIQAGYPEGVFQSLIIDVDQVESVIASPIVQAVAFTGSERAGSIVGSLAGKHIKKSILELGGSDALLVLADADAEKAAEIAIKSRMLNSGQSCNGAKRFIVAKEVADQFTQAVIANVEKLKIGDPTNPTVDMGPLARPDLADTLMDQVAQSVAAGGSLKLKGTIKDCLVTPSLFVGVKPGMPVFDEETFGPVAAITTVNDEEEAIRLANLHRYGLDASIWTKDVEKAMKMTKRLDAGSVFINGISRSDSRFPFGGVKKSGYGRELSTYGLKEFANIKAVIVDK